MIMQGSASRSGRGSGDSLTVIKRILVTVEVN